MKIKKVYRSAFERQIGEAVSIHIEKKKGNILMNGKSEYNRCKIPRISMDTESEALKKLKEEEVIEKERKARIKLLRKRKKEDKDLVGTCDRIVKENKEIWDNRYWVRSQQKEKTIEFVWFC